MKFSRNDSYSKYSGVHSYCDPKLGSGCNLDKDLRKNRRDNQLVKHKNTRLYLLLYILINHEK